jgi:hypothetical protein
MLPPDPDLARSPYQSTNQAKSIAGLLDEPGKLQGCDIGKKFLTYFGQFRAHLCSAQRAERRDVCANSSCPSFSPGRG